MNVLTATGTDKQKANGTLRDGASKKKCLEMPFWRHVMGPAKAKKESKKSIGNNKKNA